MKRRLALGGLLGAVALAFWFGRPDPQMPTVTRTMTAPARPAELVSARAAPRTFEPAEPATASVPVMAAGSADSSIDGPRHPHPIEPTRLRIYRENNLIGSLNRAMDLGRYQELRWLNARYNDEFPEDEHQLQQAYNLIADCQEELSDERQARAREFWKQHRSSQLRRFVRRHCRL